MLISLEIFLSSLPERLLFGKIARILLPTISMICSIFLIGIGEFRFGLLLPVLAIGWSQIGIKNFSGSDFADSMLMTSGIIVSAAAIALLMIVLGVWEIGRLYQSIAAYILILVFGCGFALISLAVRDYLNSPGE